VGVCTAIAGNENSKLEYQDKNGTFRTHKLSSETSEQTYNPKGYDNSGGDHLNNARRESQKPNICEVCSQLVV